MNPGADKGREDSGGGVGASSLKILYVSSLWSGVRPMLFNGERSPTGMPAFVRVAERLYVLGHQVDFVFIGGKPRETKIGPDWLKAGRIEQVDRRPRWALPGRFGRDLRAVVSRLMRSRDYDFVYLHGLSAGAVAGHCRKTGIPFGQRIYGVRDFDKKVERKSRLLLWMTRRWEYEAFTQGKSFLLVTRDGSRGDRVYRLLNERGTIPFYFSLNGVQHITAMQRGNPLEMERPYLFYPSRFQVRKRNYLAVRFLKHLHDAGLRQFRLVFAGQESSPEAVERARGEMEETGLADSVEFAGALRFEEMQDYYAKAAAVLSFYSVANLGNVTLEALACGSILVSLQDPTLDGIIKDGETGVVGLSIEEAAEKFLGLIQDETKYRRVRANAGVHAKRILPSWTERADWEVSLIESAARGERMDNLPPFVLSERSID